MGEARVRFFIDNRDNRNSRRRSKKYKLKKSYKNIGKKYVRGRNLTYLASEFDCIVIISFIDTPYLFKHC